MTETSSTDDGGSPVILSCQQFSEPPVIGHTYDINDEAAPVYVDFAHPRLSAGDGLSGHGDVRCARPGRRGCRAQLIIVRVPGKPPMVVLEHQGSCPWLRACLAGGGTPRIIAEDGPEMQALLAIPPRRLGS